MSLTYVCVLYIHNVCRTQKIYFVILICCSEITFSMRIYLANSIENYNSNTIYCSLYFPPHHRTFINILQSYYSFLFLLSVSLL